MSESHLEKSEIDVELKVKKVDSSTETTSLSQNLTRLGDQTISNVQETETGSDSVKNKDVLLQTSMAVDSPANFAAEQPLTAETLLKSDTNEHDKSIQDEKKEDTYIAPLLRRKSTSTKLPSCVSSILPKVNCTEKIIFCVDHSDEMFQTSFNVSTKKNVSSTLISVVKSLKQFMKTKSLIDNRHQYSLVMLNEDAQLITDFSSRHDDITYMLEDITASKRGNSDSNNEQSTEFDVTSIFNAISGHVQLPKYKQNVKLPPPYTVRVIMIYGRSYCHLNIDETVKAYKEFQSNPYFFFDIVYIHDNVEKNNNVYDIFNEICNLALKDKSHVYEVATDTNIALLYNIFGKLLGHPLQRPNQDENEILYDLVV